LKTITGIVKEVEDNIVGRLANKIGDERTNNTEVLLEYVLKSGGGNHLEIGTLFGGSAIAVALLKNYYGQSGIVVCATIVMKNTLTFNLLVVKQQMNMVGD